MIQLDKDSNLLQLPEQLYGTIKRVGILNKEPILYGDYNLLKNGDLCYILGAKQVYRFIKTEFEQLQGQESDNNQEILTYIFETIDTPSTEGLQIPENQRGFIYRAGKLFDKIIYGGDPNLVNNGDLFYHSTLPYVNVTENNKDVITLSTMLIDENGDVVTDYTEYDVNSKQESKYSRQYFTFDALEDSVFTLTIDSLVTSTYVTSVSYSTDEGKTWITTQNDNNLKTITTPTIHAGEKVLWKGIAKAYSVSGKLGDFYSKFAGTGDYNVSGNIKSLLYGDDFLTEEDVLTEEYYTFRNLFQEDTHLISAENLVLPFNVLTKSCYRGMFINCTALTAAPKLPATVLADYCYSAMFDSCTSLQTAPELPATTLAQYCYQYMFQDCSLTSAPVLPALELVSHCYHYMFDGCGTLNYIKAMFTTTPSDTYTLAWVDDVSSTGTFVKNSVAEWNVTGTNGVPSGWTVETADS